MRYLGNKESLIAPILDLLEEHNLLQRNLVFFDAFCGMGAVADNVTLCVNSKSIPALTSGAKDHLVSESSPTISI